MEGGNPGTLVVPEKCYLFVDRYVVPGETDEICIAQIMEAAEQFGLSIMDLGSLAQIAGAMGRSMSPIAGAAIICAGLAKVNPIEVSKRNALPCLASAIVLMLLL